MHFPTPYGEEIKYIYQFDDPYSHHISSIPVIWGGGWLSGEERERLLAPFAWGQGILPMRCSCTEMIIDGRIESLVDNLVFCKRLEKETRKKCSIGE